MYKKIVLVVAITALVAILVSACGRTPDEMKQQIYKYKELERQARSELQTTNKELNIAAQELKEVRDKLDIDKHKLKGGKVKYVFVIELKQEHFTLDIGKHIKDSMNKVKFEIPVDEEFYSKFNTNDELLSEFRGGSFWIEGSIGEWKLTLIDKKIIKEE